MHKNKECRPGSDPYVLFTWQRMCELLNRNIDLAEEVDIDKLRSKIPEIKAISKGRAQRVAISGLKVR